MVWCSFNFDSIEIICKNLRSIKDPQCASDVKVITVGAKNIITSVIQHKSLVEMFL